MSDPWKELMMSVARHLGLLDPELDQLAQAREGWRCWQREHPQLRVCPDLLCLRSWTRRVTPAQSNQVLLVLGELGAVDGYDDPAATSALAWTLLPGATVLARALRSMHDRMDELVAAQLWISARTVNWRGRGRVASTVLMNTRRDLLRDLETGYEKDGLPVLAQTLQDLATVAITTTTTGAADYLYDLMEHAVGDGVVGRDEAHVLLRLAELTDTPRTWRGNGGLTARSGVRLAAQELEVSSATVFRRATSALSKLQDSYGQEARSA